MQKTVYSLIFGFVVIMLASAQEFLYFATDKTYYFSSQKICFISVLGLSNDDTDQVFNLSLIDKNNVIKFQGRYQVENGLATGSFDIPLALPTDIYRLVFYYEAFGAKMVNVYVSKISILNVFNEPDFISDDSLTTENDFFSGSDSRMLRSNFSDAVSLKTDKAKYKCGERVVLSISNATQSKEKQTQFARFSLLAGSALNEGYKSPVTTISIFNNELSNHALIELTTDHENRCFPNLIFCGTLLFSDTLAWKELIVSSSDYAAFERIYITKPSFLSFNINQISEFEDLNMQLFDGDQFVRFQFEAITTEDILKHIPPYKKSLEDNVNLLRTLEKKKQFGMVNFHYWLHSFETDTISQSKSKNCLDDSEKFYFDPYLTFKPSQFDEVKNFKEFISLYVPQLKIKQDNLAKYYFIPSLTGREDISNNEPITVLVNGLVVKDIDQLLNINPGKIASLDLKLSRIIHHDYVFNGIMVIKLHEEKYLNEISDCYKPLDTQYRASGEHYFERINQVNQVKDNRKPDLRETIYWHPKLFLQPGTDTTLVFYTSDIPGMYELVLRGYSNTGEFLQNNVQIIVE